MIEGSSARRAKADSVYPLPNTSTQMGSAKMNKIALHNRIRGIKMSSVFLMSLKFRLRIMWGYRLSEMGLMALLAVLEMVSAEE